MLSVSPSSGTRFANRREGVVVSFELVDLPDIETEPRRQELGDREIHKRGSGWSMATAGNRGRALHRHKRAGLSVHAGAVAPHGVDIEKAARPESELARVDVQPVIDGPQEPTAFSRPPLITP